MKITYLGHAAFSIEIGGQSLLIDPFISANELATEVNLDELKPDYILLTHGHEDHVLDAQVIAQKCGAKIVSNFEIVSWYAEHHEIEGVPMNIGGQIQLDDVTIKSVTAVHSSVLPDGSYAGNPGGFVIWDSESCIYVAGDTALTLDMQLIPQICPPLAVAILPIGDQFTMGYKDACLAAEFVNCEQVIGCHYDTWEPLNLNHDEAQVYFANQGKSLLLMAIGEEAYI